MSTIPEQISAAAQTQLATQLAVINTLSHTAFGGIQKLIALNFSLIQQSMESSVATTHQLMAAKGPQDVLALSSAQAQPRIEKILAYGRELASISNAARSDFLQAVGSVSAAQPAATVKVSSAPVASKATVESPAAPAVAASTKPAKPTEATKAVAKPAPKAPAKLAAKPATKPVASAKKPGAKPALSGNTQLPLLTESVAKPAAAKTAPAKTVAAKAATVTTAKAKPATAPAPVAAAPAIKASTPKAKPAAAKPTAPTQATTAASAPAALKVEVKPALKTEVKAEVKPTVKAEVKPTLKAEPAAQSELAKTASVATVAPSPAVSTTVAAEPVVSKPAITGLPTKAAAKPGFPAVGGRPAFKEKSSKATGAKMRVRQ